MTIPPALTVLIDRIKRELNQIEAQAIEGIQLARDLLRRFPDNFAIIQSFAFLNASLFYVETSRRQIQTRLEDVTQSDVTEEIIQEAGEDLSIELGRVLETKISVIRMRNRLENLR